MLTDYWTTITNSKDLYQMGGQSHRIYLLDLLCGLHNDRKREFNVTPIRSLLDVGCGTGPIYELLKFDQTKPDSKWNSIEKYKGIDPSDGMIDVCKLHFPEGDWAVDTAEDMLENWNSWDCILYMHALDYVYDVDTAIKEMARVTKQYICIVLWQPLDYTKGATHRLNNSVNGTEKVDWSTARLQHFAWGQLQESFTKYGLKVILKKDDEEINKEGRNNTLILLEKV